MRFGAGALPDGTGLGDGVCVREHATAATRVRTASNPIGDEAYRIVMRILPRTAYGFAHAFRRSAFTSVRMLAIELSRSARRFASSFFRAERLTSRRAIFCRNFAV